MATLVLTAVGAALGGPIGAAIGAVVGQQIDQRIFRPKGREGPRLTDLRIQSSSYGAPIPKLFGTLRVAGTVIWATDLVEARTREGGGKGKAKTTRYSYSASFAVLLSGRPIRAVRRIWADGNLLRGAAGDWKSETGFRLHLGGAEQPVDPLIAAAEGATPAYRDCAYAVFEHMQLGPYGNRIPSLTFEVEADAGPVSTGDVLRLLAGGRIDAGGGAMLDGFAATGASLGALAETLDEVAPLRLVDDGARLRLASPADPVATLDPAELAEGGRDTRSSGEAPVEASLAYLDPARDYQTGLQRARRPGAGRGVARLELPAAITADAAKSLVEQALAERASRRVRRRVRCGWARLELRPGVRVRTPDGAAWRIVERGVTREGVTLDLVSEAGLPALDLPADAGRNVAGRDAVHGPTTVHLLDLPMLGDTIVDAPRLWIAAAGTSPGWRRASLLASVDEGASWIAIGETAPSATIGTAVTRLGTSPEFLRDDANMVEVRLLHGEMPLADADADRLAAGANLALLGDELIQFGRASPLGEGRWLLERLVRGRRGTGWAAGAHAVGERFVLLDEAALFGWDPPLAAAGRTVRLLASGIGDASPVEARADAIGAALGPPAPAQLVARRRDDGGFLISWSRSSRLGWRWLDGADAPLAEEREAYRITIARADGSTRTREVGQPATIYGSDEVGADRLIGPSVAVSVLQLGTRAASRPARIDLLL